MAALFSLQIKQIIRGEKMTELLSECNAILAYCLESLGPQG